MIRRCREVRTSERTGHGPEITLNGPTEIEPGLPFTLTLSDSDPGPDTIASITVDWGDGIVETFAGLPGQLTHAYAEEGGYVIYLTVNDEDGSYAAGWMIEVYTPAPQMSSSSTSLLGDGTAELTVAYESSVGAAVASYEWDTNGDGLFDDGAGTVVQLAPNVTPIDPDAAAELAATSPTYWARLRVVDGLGRTTVDFIPLDQNGQIIGNVADPFLTEPEEDYLDRRGSLRSGGFPAATGEDGGYLRGTDATAGLQELTAVVGALGVHVLKKIATEAALALIPWDEFAEVSVRSVGWFGKLIGRRPGLTLKVGDNILELSYEEAMRMGKRLGVKTGKLEDVKAAIEDFATFAKAAKTSRAVNFPADQLNRKFAKHARAFGITGNNNSVNRQLWKDAMESYVLNAGTKVIPGIYNRGAGKHKVTLFLDEPGRRVLIRDDAGIFDSAWGNLTDEQMKGIKEWGALGGY